MKRTKIKDLLKSDKVNSEFVIEGWVRTRRGNKNVGFIAINDWSTINNIQVVADMTIFTEEQMKYV